LFCFLQSNKGRISGTKRLKILSSKGIGRLWFPMHALVKQQTVHKCLLNK
jgi:hypothetical protein